MKRMIAVFLLAAMVLSLAACTGNPKGPDIFSLQKDNEELFMIYDYDAQTIRVGKTLVSVYDPNGELIWEEDRKDEYRYEYDDGNITIFYPNGAVYYESPSATGAVISWEGNYDTERYVDGSIMAQHLTKAYNAPSRNWDDVLIVGLLCLLLIGLCIADIMHPDIFYKLRYGLWVQNAEPTEFALMMSRIGGIVGIVCAVILFLVVAFG